MVQLINMIKDCCSIHVLIFMRAFALVSGSDLHTDTASHAYLQSPSILSLCYRVWKLIVVDLIMIQWCSTPEADRNHYLIITAYLYTCRSVQECVQRYGGGEVRGVWYGRDVPLFQLNFWTKMGLKKLLENQSDLRKELMRKISSMLKLYIIYVFMNQ